MEKLLVNNLVTKELLADEFGKLLCYGGWRPTLMPDYINNVMECVARQTNQPLDQVRLKHETIRRMKELDPILFKKE